MSEPVHSMHSDLQAIADARKDAEQAREDLRLRVLEARARGRSWTQIGMILGVSKQAARERFGDKSQ